MSQRLTLFIKSGRDGGIGACPQSQKVLMLLEFKKSFGILDEEFSLVPVNLSRPPEAFIQLGIRLRVPALCYGKNEPIDGADEIVSFIESRWPGGLIQEEESRAELATRDVSKTHHQLETELKKLNEYMIRENLINRFLLGQTFSLLDFEVLPKLHQVRVAAFGIKGYEIPSKFTGIWRFLHAAYSEQVFVKSCPTDTEILLHWLEHLDDVTFHQRKEHLLSLHDKTPQFSFSVPVYAKPIILE